MSPSSVRHLSGLPGKASPDGTVWSLKPWSGLGLPGAVRVEHRFVETTCG
ncbi:hypothetical protein [Chloracidobacterium thermophilum]|nr:hypothetical protein [Chloracidobacterium thermophilum]QUV77764.1 hypothetical protein J8C08_06375 [Chloracidobacterium thermophilum]